MHKLNLEDSTQKETKQKSAKPQTAQPQPAAPQSSQPEPTQSQSSQPTLDEQQAVRQNQNSQAVKKANKQPGKTKNSNKTENLAESRRKPKQKDDMSQKNKKILLIISLVAIAAGVGTGIGGFKLRTKTTASKPSKQIEQVTEGKVKKGDVFGLESDLFKDTATGYLEKGGIDGEGSHKLLREGGPSQTVYLTSSTIDLDQLVGMQVKVWGETNKGQVAAWLMDAGKVEVLETQAEPPFEQEL